MPLNPFVSPFTPFDPTLEPQPQPQPQPPGRNADPCNCAKETESKKKKKKKPREVCYRGTYVEKSKSLTKQRKEQVPCQ